MSVLTKESRDALGEHDFAVPGKRALPIHDAKHTRMAWDMVSKTKDLTPAERAEARSRIKERAHKLGINTEKWGRLNASVTLSAMALNIANDGHPNKMPFSGILTRIDQPSDVPPGGSGGKLITISAEAAEKALSSLLGMAVDYKPDYDGHDPKSKVGLITAATIEGDAICIEGFIYAADFPEVAAEIKANKDKLGFSYEARDLYTDDPDANPVIIAECVFTGAAILRKDKAAYRTTALAAAEEEDMTPEQAKVLDDTAKAVTALADSLKNITASVEDLKKGPTKVDANAHTIAAVEPHAKALEAEATAMEAAGIGGHPQRGHAVLMRKMAGHMRAAAAMGNIPSTYNDHDYFVNASADNGNVALVKKIEDMVKPMADQVAGLGTQIKDLQAKAAAAPAVVVERKTLSPMITALLAKAGLEAPKGEGEKISIAKLDEALKGMPVEQRLSAKTGFRQAGLID